MAILNPREANAWIKAFLSDRTQQVILNGTCSNTADVHSGVPHGTVLGPTLFLIFINDLPNRVQSLVRLFADDCAFYDKLKAYLSD